MIPQMNPSSIPPSRPSFVVAAPGFGAAIGATWASIEASPPAFGVASSVGDRAKVTAWRSLFPGAYRLGGRRSWRLAEAKQRFASFTPSVP